DWRAQVVRQAVGEQPELFHKRADPVEHRIDLSAQAIERVVGARYGDPLREVACGDPVGDPGDLTDPAPDVMGEDETAQQPHKPGEAEREKKRTSDGGA